MAHKTLFAIKNGRKRKFTELQWELMGKNKEGWVRMDEISVSPSETVAAPPTGEKKVKVKEIKVEGSEDAKKDIPPVEDGKKADEIVVVGEEQKSEFLLAITGLNKTAIKNFFDKKEVAYDNKANAGALKTQLAEYFNYDIAKYNTEFSV